MPDERAAAVDAAMGVRRSARVVCIDEDGRTLLFLTHWERRTAPPRWLTPGGGIEAGESERDAAARELFEETGQRVSPDALVGPVAHARFATPEGMPVAASDAVTFLWRCAHFAIDDAHWTDDERLDVLEARWWSEDEIRASDEVFSDEGVLAVLDRLRPASPMPGDAVRVEGVKWNGKPHWRYDAIVLGTDEHGTWIGVEAGTTVQKGWRKEHLSGHPFVRLVPPTAESWADGAWRLPGWWHEADVDAYVDVATPPTIRRGDDGWIVEYTDLDLDLVIPSSGLAPWMDDEEQFAERSVAHAWPDDVVAHARAEADLLLAEARGDGLTAMAAGRAWLARFVGDA